MTATLKDIAEKAGVSISTASRILNSNNDKCASPATVKNIYKIAQELNYVPNKDAANLVKKIYTSPSKKLGCVYASTTDLFNDPFHSCLGRSIQASASEYGYIIGYSLSTCNLSKTQLELYLKNNIVDGIILMGRITYAALETIKKYVRNIVYVGINPINQEFDEVICDSFGATNMAVQHLISLGHKDIGYIGVAKVSNGVEYINEFRYLSYLDTLKKNNMPIKNEHIRLTEDLSLESSYNATKDILCSSKIPTAIFCAYDMVAIGAMRAINEANLSIPDDIAVVGLANVDMACYIKPSLTSINIPLDEMGMHAVQLMKNKIEKKNALPVKLNLPYNIVIRESCGKYQSLL